MQPFRLVPIAASHHLTSLAGSPCQSRHYCGQIVAWMDGLKPAGSQDTGGTMRHVFVYVLLQLRLSAQIKDIWNKLQSMHGQLTNHLSEVTVNPETMDKNLELSMR